MRLVLFVFLMLVMVSGWAQEKDTLVRDTALPARPMEPIYEVNLPSGRVAAPRIRLLHDDTTYTRKAPWYVVSSKVLSANVTNWALARYFYKFDWPAKSVYDWKTNIKRGPEWDVDRFSINFVGHPHTGSYYFNAARSNGYSFWRALPFAIQGSLTWEFLGEVDPASTNDLINTPISGMFLGEVFYRISSNILDDRKRGAERFGRELLAGVINPTRALNRLTQGKTFRVVNREVYQKEPMQVTLSAGLHKVNNKVGYDNLFGTGASNALVNLQFDYGDPYELRARKPFDVFRFRIEMSYGADSNLLDNVLGYGVLAGKNRGNNLFMGIFQHFDYWRNNNIFELGTMGFGGGLLHRQSLGRKTNLHSSFHLGVVPLAGNNTRFGPDTSHYRRYNFGGGLQGKLEERLDFGRAASLGLNAYYYWIHTYNGLPGNSFVGVFRPTFSVRLYKGLRLGFEHHIYTNKREHNDVEELYLKRTEQKVFLMLGN
jgi:hypothetical protein